MACISRTFLWLVPVNQSTDEKCPIITVHLVMVTIVFMPPETNDSTENPVAVGKNQERRLDLLATILMV